MKFRAVIEVEIEAEDFRKASSVVENYRSYQPDLLRQVNGEWVGPVTEFRVRSMREVKGE